jgi:hypothetical protein
MDMESREIMYYLLHIIIRKTPLLWLYLQMKLIFFLQQEEKKVLHFAPEQEFYNVLRNKWTLIIVTTDLLSHHLADVKADICNLIFWR